MFEYGDRVVLSGEIINKKGECCTRFLTFPLKPDYFLPEDTTRVIIFEYHEGREIYGHCSFAINVGNITNIEKISKIRNKRIHIEEGIFDTIKHVDSDLCYFEDESGIQVYAAVEPGDIVVKDVNELKEILKTISSSFSDSQTRPSVKTASADRRASSEYTASAATGSDLPPRANRRWSLWEWKTTDRPPCILKSPLR